MGSPNGGRYQASKSERRKWHYSLEFKQIGRVTLSHVQLLLIPEQSLRIQLANKIRWNQQRSLAEADFFTIGYSGRTIAEFTTILLEANVSTVLDIRQNAVSPYKPEFSKARLKQNLERNGIQYIHRADLGVPRDIRAGAVGQQDRSSIWDWYDLNVVRSFAGKNLDEFFNCADHPIAFMCSESDPYSCHRHRLALALELNGLKGYDL
jgi:hypothetical protein